eukprot:m.177224 g.177224  ORF g.177224 m.177224 type:complete len:374 (-) comp16814_c0_seq1:2727-3848(-)
MYSRRDPTGSITNLKQSRYLEPSSSSEAAFAVPRSQNVRFNAESIRVTGDPKTPFHQRDPAKLYSSAVHATSPQSTKARRQLPTPPSAKERKLQTFEPQHRVYGSNKTAPTGSTEAHAYGTSQERDTSGPTVRPLEQDIQATNFHSSSMDMRSEFLPGKAQWRGGHGASEREPIGKLPNYQPGMATEQYNSYVGAKDFLTSLRVQDASANGEAWWKPEHPPANGYAALEEHNTMPSVFHRLTDHRGYTGAHKHRFTPDGVGLGLEGRRDDDEEQVVIAGGGKIVRDVDEEMDSPHKPVLPWDAEKRSRSHSATRRRSGSRPNSRSGSRQSVFDRLYEPSRTQRGQDGDHEIKQKALESYGVNQKVIPKWQSGL